MNPNLKGIRNDTTRHVVEHAYTPIEPNWSVLGTWMVVLPGLVCPFQSIDLNQEGWKNMRPLNPYWDCQDQYEIRRRHLFSNCLKQNKQDYVSTLIFYIFSRTHLYCLLSLCFPHSHMSTRWGHFSQRFYHHIYKALSPFNISYHRIIYTSRLVRFSKEKCKREVKQLEAHTK